MRKITCDPQNIAVRDIVKDYNEKKMAVVKSFQRREVWRKNTINEYIESVSEGSAVSGIIVADIESGIEASEAHGDFRGLERYNRLFNDGMRTVNEDGQNRLRKGLIAFIDNEITFTGTLYDLEYNKRQFKNIKFEKLPMEFQQAFLSSTVVMVTIKNAPFNKLPHIFRKLNSGEPLNRTEMRQSFQTDISDWIRKHSEGSYHEMWSKFSGCNEQAIKRMRDIEWFTQSFMSCNSYTKDRFFRDPDMDQFYKIGENKTLDDVPEYSESERRRFTSILDVVNNTVAQQQTVPASKRIPQRTFWALLTVAEYFYDSMEGYKVHSYDQFYKEVYQIDSRLVNESKVQQSVDLQQAKKNFPHYGEGELSAMAPDKNYYWSQCRRMETPENRRKRQTTLIGAVRTSISSGQFTSIYETEELAAK